MIIKTGQGEMTIRAAQENDASQVRALRLEGLERHPHAFSADYFASAAETVDVWQARIASYASEAKGVIMVAVNPAGRLVGLCGVIADSTPKLCHSG